MTTHIPFVYGLYDPAEAGHVRYVGMAPSNPSRPRSHAQRARKELTDDSHLMRWIRKIQAEGREPSVIILEQLNEDTERKFLGFVESCYIKSLRQIGHRLCNENDGGWGGSNGPHTPETSAVMKAGWTPEVRARVGEASRARMLGSKASDETRARQSKARRARTITEQQKVRVGLSRKAAWDNATAAEREQHAANVSAGRRLLGIGHTQLEETRIKISNALKGRKQSEEWRAKNSAAQIGKIVSPETKAKQSASQKEAWRLRKEKNNAR